MMEYSCQSTKFNKNTEFKQYSKLAILLFKDYKESITKEVNMSAKILYNTEVGGGLRVCVLSS